MANSPTNHTDPTGTCFAAAWQSFNRSFELLDEMKANLDQAVADVEANGEISDQTLIDSAQLVRDAEENLNRFFEACGVELTFWQMALPTIGGIAGALRTTTTRLLPGATRLGPAAPQTALRGGAGPVRVGQQGLDALGITQNTSRIRLPGGGCRVPDILDEAGGIIGEVKNVQSLSYTSQLRDYVSYAQSNGLQFDLYVRGSTRLSGPLQRAIDDGLINLFRPL